MTFSGMTTFRIFVFCNRGHVIAMPGSISANTYRNSIEVYTLSVGAVYCIRSLGM